MLRAILKRLLQVMLHFSPFGIFAIREGWRISPLSGTTARVRYTCFRILTWLPDFLVVFLYSVWFSLCPSLFCELRGNGVVKNLQFWLFNLGVMLAFQYIERGRLRINPNHLLTRVCSHENVGRRIQFRRCFPKQRFILWPTFYIRANHERHRRK